MARRKPVIIWGRLFPALAHRAEERQFYAIEGRGSVRTDDLGALSVQYYPRSDSTALETMPCSELAAIHSQDDLEQKTLSVLAFASMVGALLAVLLGHLPHVALEAPPLFVFLTVLALFVAYAMVRVQFNFNNMDKAWQSAIRQLFDHDMRVKMFGIRDCMLTFRRFIKWRRFMSYVLVPVWTCIVLEAVMVLVALWRGDSAVASWPVASFLLTLIALHILTISRFSFLRWFYTNLRDPSLQLSVMLAEENREAVNALRPRIR